MNFIFKLDRLLKLGIYVIIILLQFSCVSALKKESKKIILADQNASKSTRYLMARIKELPKKGYAFGQQDATAYGVRWKNKGTDYKSDVNDVVGDFPGVYGFELGHLELGAQVNLDSVNFKLMNKLIQKADRDRGIITISWHPDNPVTLKNAWDPTAAVSTIIEGGVLHLKYKDWLRKVANFLNELKTKSGKKIPVVFRPFHEMNGSWFWWGAKSCTPSEFKSLWQQTFNILTKQYKVNNAIFCYSTDQITSQEEYLRFYPGDAYVDVLGIDLYHKSTTENYIEVLNTNIDVLAAIAHSKDKPFALSEGGLEKIPIKNWWTQVLDKNIASKGLSWALVWRNAWENHHYVPYDKKQVSFQDFVKFKNLEHVLFLKDLKKIK